MPTGPSISMTSGPCITSATALSQRSRLFQTVAKWVGAMPCACAGGKALATTDSGIPTCAATAARGIGGLPAIASRTVAACSTEAQSGPVAAVGAPCVRPGATRVSAARKPSSTAVLEGGSDIMRIS